MSTMVCHLAGEAATVRFPFAPPWQVDQAKVLADMSISNPVVRLSREDSQRLGVHPGGGRTAVAGVRHGESLWLAEDDYDRPRRAAVRRWEKEDAR